MGSGSVLGVVHMNFSASPHEDDEVFAFRPDVSGNYVNMANTAASLVAQIGPLVASYVPDRYKTADPALYAAYVNYALLALAKTAYETADPYLK